MTQGKVATLDVEDWPIVAPYRWYAVLEEGRWYAHAASLSGNRRQKKIRMHNLIMGTTWIDHRDGDGLNNRRSNIRPCTNAMNQQNTGPRGGSSDYKGVSWVAGKARWRVAFRCQGRFHFVGYFRDEREAAMAYDAAILPLAGEFARLNFPPSLAA